jgi:RluA family pseudouridine synthase
MVQDSLGKKYDSLTFRPALVHRIDRDTSWCVLIAKEKKTLEALLSQLQGHEIEKVYHALVFGAPKPSAWTIREKLLRLEDAKNEAKVRIDPMGQVAVTHYRLLETFCLLPQIDISCLECRIETGRTHQIRVHLSHIGVPIVWDKLYGDKKKNAYLMREKWLNRQMLHAKRLTFCHPITKKSITVDAPYPSDWLFAK